MSNNQKFPLYKGKPLVRSGNELYYGDMNDDYVVKMNIKSFKTLNDSEIPDKVSIQLISTSLDVSPRKRILRTGETNGLFNAIDIGYVWLRKVLSMKPQD